MVAYRKGEYVVRKDGTQYYKVFKGRKRIARFLLLSQCINYIESVI